MTTTIYFTYRAEAKLFADAIKHEPTVSGVRLRKIKRGFAVSYKEGQ